MHYLGKIEITLISQQAPHISPFPASYRMPIVDIF